MKVYIKPNDTAAPNNTPMEFEITVDISPKYSAEEIAAAMYKGFRIPDGAVIPGVKDAVFTDQIIVDYEMFIESVEDLLEEYYGLILFYENKSSDYSNYYSFLAKDKESGKIYFKFRLRLRISNHPAHRSTNSQKHKKEETTSDKYKDLTKGISRDPRPYTKSIVVNDEIYDSYETAFVDIDAQIAQWVEVMRK